MKIYFQHSYFKDIPEKGFSDVAAYILMASAYPTKTAINHVRDFFYTVN
jgi:hypothetical protein